MNVYARQQGIEIARSSYRADVRVATADTGSSGYLAYIGTILLSRRAFEYPEDAWDAILERLVLVRPGATVLMSPEFGDQVRQNIELIGGRTGSITERKRFEVRAMSGYDTALSHHALLHDSRFHDFQVFELVRQYRDDAPSRDIRQARVGTLYEPYRFASLAAAAEYVVAALKQALRDNPSEASPTNVLPAEPRGARITALGAIVPSSPHSTRVDRIGHSRRDLPEDIHESLWSELTP